MIFTLNSSDIGKNGGKGFGYFPACGSDCRQIAVSVIWFPVLLPEMNCEGQKAILSTHCPRVSNHTGHPTGTPHPGQRPQLQTCFTDQERVMNQEGPLRWFSSLTLCSTSNTVYVKFE